jgi:hypothetical protein
MSMEYSKRSISEQKLDPIRRRPPTEPTDPITKPTLENIPTASTECVQNYTYTWDVAKIFHDQTNLRRNWTILRDVLELNSDKFANDEYIRKDYLLDKISYLLDLWILSKGKFGATVGVLYDKLKEHGYVGVGGELK